MTIDLSENDVMRIAAATVEMMTAVISQKEQPESKLLTSEQAMALFNVTRPTLRNWEKNKQIDTIRKGRRVFFVVPDGVHTKPLKASIYRNV